VAELTFFYGTMNCGKSTLALQIHHNAVTAGKRCLLLTKHDRQAGAISSRIGLAQPAEVVTDALDLQELVRARIAAGDPIDVVICDEAQFYSPTQIEQLAEVVDELDVDVQAFGLLTDFTTTLFPGSQRLLELSDRRRSSRSRRAAGAASAATSTPAPWTDGSSVRGSGWSSATSTPPRWHTRCCAVRTTVQASPAPWRTGRQRSST